MKITGTSVECPLSSSCACCCAAHKETASTRTTSGNVTLLEAMPGLSAIRGLLPSHSTPFPPSRGMPRERHSPNGRQMLNTGNAGAIEYQRSDTGFRVLWSCHRELRRHSAKKFLDVAKEYHMPHHALRDFYDHTAFMQFFVDATGKRTTSRAGMIV